MDAHRKYLASGAVFFTMAAVFFLLCSLSLLKSDQISHPEKVFKLQIQEQHLQRQTAALRQLHQTSDDQKEIPRKFKNNLVFQVLFLIQRST